jgi:hypothetical protein
MRILADIIKVRMVMGYIWELQVAHIKTTGEFQATYYYGAEEKIWGNAFPTAEEAIQHVDILVDMNFGPAISKPIKLPSGRTVNLRQTVYQYRGADGKHYERQEDLPCGLCGNHHNPKDDCY